jgi:hypothetical protein
MPSPTLCNSHCCGDGAWKEVWRRGRDSNPRYPFGYAGFQDRSHQPLGHLSAYYNQQLSHNLKHHRKFVVRGYARFQAPLGEKLSLPRQLLVNVLYVTTTIKDGISKPVQKSKSDSC